MESLIMQQGDCNAGATYQMLMNHIFAPYLRVFVYIYLDDIIIFLDSIEDHVTLGARGYLISGYIVI